VGAWRDGSRWKMSEEVGGQDKGRRHHCRAKLMSAHGFLQHVENCHRAAPVGK
jgi:hypothetical protein